MKNEKYFKPDTYVVALKNHVAGIFAFNKGEIAKIINSKSIEYQSTKWAFANGFRYEEDGEVKWFETLEEAQAFSKSLFLPSIPPSIPETKTFDDFGIDPGMEYEATIINSWQGQGTNRWLSGSFCTSEGTWSYHITIFTSNRKLSRLEFKNGIWGLYVGGSANIFIRAEGFIEYYRAELLKMAIQNYPIGTKYSSAFDRTADGECTMTPYWSCDDAINGGGRYIWYKGKWGKILDVPTEKNEEPVDKGWFDKEEWVPKVGDWVEIISLTSKGRTLNGIIGYVYQIGEIDDEINGKWYRCTEKTYFLGGSMPIECIAPAEPPNTQSVNAPKEPPVEEEFKIGDVVTITSWYYAEIPLPQKGIIKEIGKSDRSSPYQIELSKSSETEGATFSAGSTWWFKPGEFVKGFTENTTVEHSNAVEQEEAIPELTHNIKPNSINNNLKSTTAVVGTIKQKSKTIKF
jgi:hypothetical protein